MITKESITVRIDKTLVEKIETSGLNKTKAIENALSYFFDTCPNIKGYSRQEIGIKEAVCISFKDPEIIEAIRCVVAATLKQELETLNNGVKQKSKTQKGNVQQKSKAIDKAGPAEREDVQQKSKTRKEDVQQKSKAIDKAGPTKEEISKALSRSLEELFTLEELARIKDLTPEEQEDLRKSKARVSWVLEVKEKEGSKNFDKSSKNAGTCGREYRRGRDMLKEFGF